MNPPVPEFPAVVLFIVSRTTGFDDPAPTP